MRIKISKFFIILASIFILLSIPLILADEYVTTEAFFYIPSDVSFSVKLPGPSAAVGSDESAPYPSTTWISFNATDGNDQDVQPQTEGVDAYRQSEFLIPIFYVTNDGNTPISIHMQIESLAGCLSVCGNSTCAITAGCSGASFTPIDQCLNIQSPSEPTLVTSLPQTNSANISLYADFNGCSIGQYPSGSTGYTITHRSSV